MQKFYLPGLLAVCLWMLPGLLSAQESISEKVEDMQAYEGYFDFYWDAEEGKIYLEIDRFDTEFLYVNSLTGGVGSNDIGLDRNQLGDDRVVVFRRVGPKVLLEQPNYGYRAISDNEEEQKSVEEAFAKSVLWGFKVEAEEEEAVLVDLTPFLMRDAHGVVDRLQSREQGKYKLEADRSAIYLDRTRNFPQNSEFEALLTFVGEPKGGYIRSVAPTAEAVTVRQHHSFVRLPDDNYEPRVYDPRSGFNNIAYRDYATPIEESLVKRFITRHRLQKKNPEAASSEPVEPIVYYLDRGTPEPIRSALLEGASWWNQAFEAAGYENAFRVEVLPEDADPMDVRYNVINWVHRSTRGWSYGSSVVDPRTGEIIKGHVLLGSLRVRQDFLIAQGLIEAYENGAEPDPRMKEMALARLRQLSAHEVGHTLGLSHNFAASYNNRASVMDYPHPLIQQEGLFMNFEAAYDTGIGEWDKRTILYGYQDFPGGVEEEQALKDILSENEEQGFIYISDQDARPAYGAHPVAHLWDNGESAVAELNRMMNVRRQALQNFSEKNIPEGAPMATLENVLVPLYLSHRYQVEAVSKVIGGVNYSYAVRGGKGPVNEMVDDAAQREALDALLATLEPEFLRIPETVIDLIPPRAKGYNRGRELFKIHTGLTFDPLGAAEASAQHTIRFLLEPHRLARVIEQSARGGGDRLSLDELLDKTLGAVRVERGQTEFQKELARMTEKLVLRRLMEIAGEESAMKQVSAMAWLKINQTEKRLEQQSGYTQDPGQLAHYTYLLEQIRLFKRQPGAYQMPQTPDLPDGSPIGCGK